jgi:predicted 3-demethylubiquinone-9 3-methyltransferase (glyoxalase superfamily)
METGNEAQKVATFLMFDGKAEEAMNLYVSLFKDAGVKEITRFFKGEPGKEGSVKRARFTIAGQEFMCVDSPMKHEFTFTPAISIFINCKTEEELDSLYHKLSIDAKIFMPLSKYPFSNKFVWLADKYGVSWQLNLI